MKGVLIRIALLLALSIAARSLLAQPPNPATRLYPPDQLRNDYALFRGILEQYHPGIYWFTPKDRMDAYFEAGARLITDSLTETAFRNILSYVISQIRCSHTTVLPSKAYSRYSNRNRMNTFPLSLKVWPDSMSVITHFHKGKDTLPRGTIITEINGWNTRQFTDTFFQFISGDGWALNGKYQALSNRWGFGNLYRNVLGLPEQFTVTYKDESGRLLTKTIPVYNPAADSVQPYGTRSGSASPARGLKIDTAQSTAYLTLNTFARGNRLRAFFRSSFRQIRRSRIQHLVIDVRSNGGGDAGLSTLLTRYLTRRPFIIADSLYAVRKSGMYNRYIDYHYLYRTFMAAVTRKKEDGFHHFGYFERHEFHPKKRTGFSGQVYIITGGNSYSATVLMARALQGQPQVLLVGEETGGGAYGNSAWMIPKVTLPNTRIRFRLPLFRLVMPGAAATGGRGVIPDVPVGATATSIRLNIDPKTEKVKELIRARSTMGK